MLRMLPSRDEPACVETSEHQCKKAQAQLFLALLLAPFTPATQPRFFLVALVVLGLLGLKMA